MGSQGSINMPQPGQSSLGAVLQALQAVHTAFGVNTERQQQRLLELQTQKAQTEGDLANRRADENSSESKIAREEALAGLEFAQKQGVLNPQRASALKSMIEGSPAVEATAAQPALPGSFGPAQAQPEIAPQAAVPGLSAQALATNKELSPLYDFTKTKLNADASAARLAGLVGVKQEQLDETKNQNASKVGEHFESDPIIKASKMSKNSLDRSMSILQNQKKPVTAKDLNLAYNDYINAVATGGAATEGKIHREMPDTWEQSWNELKGKAGQFDDLRKTPVGQELIRQLTENISTVKNDLANATEEQAANIFQNYGQSTNAKVQEIAKTKLKTYAPKKYAQAYGGAPANENSASTAPPADPLEGRTATNPKTGKTLIRKGGQWVPVP